MRTVCAHLGIDPAHLPPLYEKRNTSRPHFPETPDGDGEGRSRSPEAGAVGRAARGTVRPGPLHIGRCSTRNGSSTPSSACG